MSASGASLRLGYLLVLLPVAGCSFNIPNGVFACVNAPDCPGGYFCWDSDGRCYDTEEPKAVCTPSTCEEAISQFAAVGVEIECGTLPNGCEGTIECGSCSDEQTCGANGLSFACGCEESTCSSVSAECDSIPVGCGTTEVIDCGQCPGELQCSDNRCVCPTGVDCECIGGCADGQICVRGECCTPEFPCSENECSPSEGLPDGCGGTAHCPPCNQGEQCLADSTARFFQCIGDCTCASEGIECGTANVCGDTRLCGFCEDPREPLCEVGRCVCVDRFEPNEDANNAKTLGCPGGCSLSTLEVEREATLHDARDQDWFEIDVVHSSSHGVRVDVSGLEGNYEIFLSYVCPNGEEEIADCSGSSSSIGDLDFCIEDGADTLRLVHECSATSGTGRIVLAIRTGGGEFAGLCDDYSVGIYSF